MGKQFPSGSGTDLEGLYLDFLHAFYEVEDLSRSESIARQFEVELTRRPDLAESIRSDEIRSMISELHGDVESAIKHRQSEIRRIFELHSLAQGSPGWNYVFAQYDYRDISDRIDLLSGLYTRVGDFGEAINLLNESRSFCDSHGIPFDGADLLEEFRQSSVPAGGKTWNP